MAPSYSDRFIPCRSSSNFDLFHIRPPTTTNAYDALLRSALFGPDSANSNIFKYKTETKKRKRPSESSLPLRFQDDDVSQLPAKAACRKVPTSPAEVYNEITLEDDFYRNLLDWSSDNVVAVGVENRVYTMCRPTGTVLAELGDGDDSSVCSVAWAPHSTHLAVGTFDGMVHLWDASRCKRIATMEGHKGPVNALAWSPALLSSGSSDTTILHRDIRTPHGYVTKLAGHQGHVCGLKWSHDNDKLASGGDDDRLLVWNRHSTNPVLEYSDHTAAVKAIAWSPHEHGLLASGGGSADQCIRFWDTAADGGDDSCLNCIYTGSQVCGLAWSKNVNEIVSTHGFPENEILVWKYPTMSKVATLTGHTKRVLYLADSPDGRQIVTGAEDGTLRFWNVFPRAPKTSFGELSFGFRSQIR